MPKLPTLVGHEKEEQVRAMCDAGLSLDVIASRTGVSRKSVQTYRDYLMRTKPPVKLEAPPEVAPGATPRERAESHAAWLKAQVDKAVLNGAPAKEVAVLSGQYVAAVRLVAQLSGALEVTAAQILRSTDFARALTAFRRAVGDDREVWARWERELALLMGEDV